MKRIILILIVLTLSIQEINSQIFKNETVLSLPNDSKYWEYYTKMHPADYEEIYDYINTLIHIVNNYKKPF